MTRNAISGMEGLPDWIDDLTPDEQERLIRSLSPDEADAANFDWPSWAHDGQRAPPKCADGSNWRTWVIMAGRGFGKTLAGSQWVLEMVRGILPSRPREGQGAGMLPGAIQKRTVPPLDPLPRAGGEALRIALVGATLDEARRVMVEGQSGLLNVAGDWVTDWRPSLRILRFTTGAEATLFSGASPEALRGPEHHFAWCDELAKWEKAAECWDMLQLGLRLGSNPRALVTTTPRPGPVLRRIMDSPGCVTTGGPTHANPHTSAAWKQAVEQLYAGTRLGRQELDGELLTDSPGALWTVETLERCRIPLPCREGLGVGASEASPCADSEIASTASSRLGANPPPAPPSPGRGGRVVIGVDPPSGDGTCGIIVCARDSHGIAHVLADHSVTARSPEGWARAVADAALVHQSDLIVAERNQGGAMVQSVLHAASARLRVKLVTATQGKSVRAEPVALLFEAGRVRLHGEFPELEAELLGMIAGGSYEGPGVSPDRADAMVWALTELMLGKDRPVPRVRLL